MQISAKLVKELRDKTNAGMMDCKKALAECECNLEKAIDWLRQKGLMTARKRAGRATKEGLVVVSVSQDNKNAAMVELNCETDFVAKNDGFKKVASDVAEMLLKESEPANVEELLERKLPSGETVDSAIKALVGTIGENMNLRRFVVCKTEGSNSFIHSYIHGAGRLGVVLAMSVEKMGPAADELAHNIAMHIAAANPIALRSEDVPEDMLEREKALFRAKLAETGKPENMWDKIMVGQVNKFYSEVVLLEQAYVKDPNGKTTIKDVLKQAEADCGKAEVKAYVRFQLGEELPGEASEEADE